MAHCDQEEVERGGCGVGGVLFGAQEIPEPREELHVEQAAEEVVQAQALDVLLRAGRLLAGPLGEALGVWRGDWARVLVGRERREGGLGGEQGREPWGAVDVQKQ